MQCVQHAGECSRCSRMFRGVQVCMQHAAFISCAQAACAAPCVGGPHQHHAVCAVSAPPVHCPASWCLCHLPSASARLTHVPLLPSLRPSPVHLAAQVIALLSACGVAGGWLARLQPRHAACHVLHGSAYACMQQCGQQRGLQCWQFIPSVCGGPGMVQWVCARVGGPPICIKAFCVWPTT